ncbi:MAG: hypothetical protein IIU55_09020, partial [Paludibacteraceae bacterium]|nr:hypothetical protein [Paludibacteraceae bacterium]
YTHEEIVEDENYIYHYIFTLELTVIPFSSDTIVVEAYDSYEWHGKVYTESGTYIYENFCSIEVLELTIIDTPTPPEPPVEPEGPCSNIQELDRKNGLRLSDFSAKTWYKMNVGDVKGSNFEVRWINDEPCVATWTTAYLSECLNTTDWSEIEWESLVTRTDTCALGLETTCTVSSSFFDKYSQIGDYIYVYVGSKVLDCDSEPQDTIIYHPTEYGAICEGGEYYWRRMMITETGSYTYEEIVEDENYTYHHIYTLELSLLLSGEIIAFPTTEVTICENELPYVWNINWHKREVVGAGTYTHEEILDCGGAIYTLELTVIPSEKVVLVEEAYDSYEWHGKVYTESGVYTYRDPYNPCVIEELHLTIIDTPTPSEPQDTIFYTYSEYATICEGETYIWRMGMEFTEAGTYRRDEIVEDENYTYHHIYILELTVIPSEKVVLVEEAYDSYEWHGRVYTESGVYTYEEWCYQEILHLTIIDTPTKPEGDNCENAIQVNWNDEITICGSTDTWYAIDISGIWERGEDITTTFRNNSAETATITNASYEGCGEGWHGELPLIEVDKREVKSGEERTIVYDFDQLLDFFVYFPDDVIYLHIKNDGGCVTAPALWFWLPVTEDVVE